MEFWLRNQKTYILSLSLFLNKQNSTMTLNWWLCFYEPQVPPASVNIKALTCSAHLPKLLWSQTDDMPERNLENKPEKVLLTDTNKVTDLPVGRGTSPGCCFPPQNAAWTISPEFLGTFWFHKDSSLTTPWFQRVCVSVVAKLISSNLGFFFFFKVQDFYNEP